MSFRGLRLFCDQCDQKFDKSDQKSNYSNLWTENSDTRSIFRLWYSAPDDTTNRELVSFPFRLCVCYAVTCCVSRALLLCASRQWRNDRPCRLLTAGGPVLGGRQNSTLATADGQKIIGGYKRFNLATTDGQKCIGDMKRPRVSDSRQIKRF